MTSGFYSYLKLAKLNTNYARRMERLSNKIFGNPIRPTNDVSMKGIVNQLSAEPIGKQDFIRNWYPRHRETHKLVMALRDYGLFRDEHEDFRDEITRQRELRGKFKGKRTDGGKKAKVSG